MTDFDSFTMNEEKLHHYSIFKISAKFRVYDSGQTLKMTKTPYLCSIHQENTCKSSLLSNLIIFTDHHSFTVNEEKFQYQSTFKNSAKVWVCDFSQNMKMTKTS